MAASILMAAALIVNGPVYGAPITDGIEHVEVGYNELIAGQPQAAIERIRANDELSSDDPTALINLGAAYAMLGDKAKAGYCYRAAIASDERYELQLADGRWLDSRRAARAASAALAKGEVLALR